MPKTTEGWERSLRSSTAREKGCLGHRRHTHHHHHWKGPAASGQSSSTPHHLPTRGGPFVPFGPTVPCHLFPPPAFPPPHKSSPKFERLFSAPGNSRERSSGSEGRQRRRSHWTQLPFFPVSGVSRVSHQSMLNMLANSVPHCWLSDPAALYCSPSDQSSSFASSTQPSPAIAKSEVYKMEMAKPKCKWDCSDKARSLPSIGHLYRWRPTPTAAASFGQFCSVRIRHNFLCGDGGKDSAGKAKAQASAR